MNRIVVALGLPLAALLAPCLGAAQSVSPASTSPSPVILTKCEVAEVATGWTFTKASARAEGARVGAVAVAFKNQSNKTAKTVSVDFTIDGVTKSHTNFNGTYSPGSVVNIGSDYPDGLAPITEPQGLGCKIVLIRFVDGSTWVPTDTSAVILRQPDSPIEVESCGVELESDPTTNYYALLQIAFKNVSPSEIKAVRFAVSFKDAFGVVTTKDTYTVSGTYSSEAEVYPDRAFTSHGFSYSPAKPAWAVYNLKPDNISTIECGVNDVLFSDGHAWHSHQSQ